MLHQLLEQKGRELLRRDLLEGVGDCRTATALQVPSERGLHMLHGPDLLVAVLVQAREEEQVVWVQHRRRPHQQRAEVVRVQRHAAALSLRAAGAPLELAQVVQEAVELALDLGRACMRGGQRYRWELSDASLLPCPFAMCVLAD